MIRHFFHISFRGFKRNGIYSFINIAGLAVGLAAAMLILMHVVHELSYDRFHEKRDRLVRILFSYTGSDGFGYSNTITAAVGPTLFAELPGVERFVRFTWSSESFLSFNDTVFTTTGVRYADSSFFDCFSFQLEEGDPALQLRQPYTMVITRSLAQQCFGEVSPIGRSVKVGGRYNVTITGIAADPPPNSHIRFKALISFSTLYLDKGLHMGWDGGNRYYTWLQLAPQFDWQRTRQLLPALLERHINKQIKDSGLQLTLEFEPITDVHLHSKSYSEGNPFMLRVLTAIALFILLLACFNYANLSTARAMKRFRETGIRKVAGATHAGLLRFYLGESVMIALVAWFIALIMIETAQPWFNGMVGSDLGLWKPATWWFVPASLVLVLFTAAISGFYPAVFLARMKPSDVLRGGFNPGKRRLRLANLLLVIQFALSSALMTGTLVIGRQLDYGVAMNRGFDIRNVTVVELTGAASKSKYAELKNACSQIPGVEAVAAISEIPVNGVTQNGYRLEGRQQVDIINSIETDADLFNVMKIPVMAGVDFAQSSDQYAVMINQQLALEAGWMDADGEPLTDSIGSKTGAIGRQIERDTLHKVIGVVSNFHFATLYDPIKPIIIARQPYTGYFYLMVRTRSNQGEEWLGQLENSWRALFPDEPFVAYPAGSMVEQGFRDERSLQSLLRVFAALALFIATLGLLGLVSYQTRQRQRDTGIRRILGASVSVLLLRDLGRFLQLVVMAHVLSLPVVYLVMERWLQSFTFHIAFPWLLTVPVLVSLLITGLAAIVWQVIRTVRANPVEAIRYE